MAWHLDGTYFENCNCDVLCPCGASSFLLPATNDRCTFLMAFHIDSGEIDGVDVSDLSVGILGDTPGKMADGGWRVGVLMDEQASEEQAEALAGVFGGQRGGPMGMLAPLIGEMMGVERASIPSPDVTTAGWSLRRGRSTSARPPSSPTANAAGGARCSPGCP